MTTIVTTSTRLTGYAKSLVYVFLAAVAFLATAAADNILTIDEVLNLAVVVLGAVLVYYVPNLTSGVGRWAKTIIAFVIAGLVAGLSVLTDGVTPSEWMQIILAAFAGVGVYITPNEPAPVHGIAKATVVAYAAQQPDSANEVGADG